MSNILLTAAPAALGYGILNIALIILFFITVGGFFALGFMNLCLWFGGKYFDELTPGEIETIYSAFEQSLKDEVEAEE